MRSLTISSLAVIACMFGNVAYGQENPSQIPKTEEKPASTTQTPTPPEEVIGPWRLICGQAEEGCVARQKIVLDKGPPEVSIDLFVTPGAGDDSAMLSFITNMDVAIAPGAAIARSQANAETPVWRADFAACGMAGCQANGLFDPDSVYGAEEPVAVLVSPEGKIFAVPVNLTRMKDVLARVKAKDVPPPRTP